MEPSGNAFDASVNPPPVENTQVCHAVERSFHPAGTGGLHRRFGCVEPDVCSGSEKLCQFHIVARQITDADVIP